MNPTSDQTKQGVEHDDIRRLVLGRRFQAGAGCLARGAAVFLAGFFGLFGLFEEKWVLALEGIVAGVLVWALANRMARGCRWSTVALNVGVLTFLVWFGQDLWRGDTWWAPVLVLGVTIPASIASFRFHPVPSTPKLGRVRGPWHRNLVRRGFYLSLALSFLVAGIVLSLVSLMSGLAGTADPEELKRAVGFEIPKIPFLAVAPVFLIASLCHSRAKRLKAAQVAEVRAVDKRRPVLLLRSFKDDRSKVIRKMGWWSFLSPFQLRRNFEEVVTEALWWFGPVIAIGRPGESVPPAGAAREYVSHDQWQAQVQRWMKEAALVVVILGKTEGVAWEYSRLVAYSCLDRTLLVMPPRSLSIEARWSLFLSSTALQLQNPPGPDQVRELILARCLPTTDGGHRVQCVLAGTRGERVYEEAFRSRVVLSVLEVGRTNRGVLKS